MNSVCREEGHLSTTPVNDVIRMKTERIVIIAKTVKTVSHASVVIPVPEEMMKVRSVEVEALPDIVTIIEDISSLLHQDLIIGQFATHSSEENVHTVRDVDTVMSSKFHNSTETPLCMCHHPIVHQWRFIINKLRRMSQCIHIS